MRRAGLPPIRLHDLRHGAATLSLAAGNDLKTVRTMLGHSSIVLTADTYTSVLPTLAFQAAESAARLVLQAQAGTTRSSSSNGLATALAATREPIGPRRWCRYRSSVVPATVVPP